MTYGEVLPNLLKKTHRIIYEIAGDGAYNIRECYETIRIK
ncbi:hypothetical protein BTN50_1671 (plasmid) [Candidatus Enterovibrio altilux]|uniref:Mobile element protein n=1 Tax=Candidatus Enterovibrio altilux TaxID=1927128 RepID=A0A291BAT3_9GAMM|nr:hypothetical protein BTN50_1671 [Candidatus Enterovibrio luxaltus]